MRRAITIAVVVAVTFMTFAGIARSRAGTGAIPARLTAAGLQQVRFGGYTFRVPASWPVYRLDRDPTRCVRYDRHAVYLGRPGADQQCPAHLVGRTTTISVQAAPAGADPAPAFGRPRIGSLPRSGASSGGEDVGRASSVYGRPLAKPDSLWFALWDRGRNLSGGPYLPADWWPGAHRIKQYLGPHLRTVRGRTVDIDSDRVYGLVYR